MAADSIDVVASHDGHVRRLTMPGGQLSTAIARAVVAAAEELVEQRDVRVVVLDARTSPFCSGPAEGLDRFDVDPAAALARLRPPVVCVIDGDCHSVGLELALATDIRICSPTASFALPDATTGQLPAWGGTQRLPRAIRRAEATAMVLTGSTINADRALSLGLVHEVHADLTAGVDALVNNLVGLGPLALELTKEAIHRGSEMPLRDGLRLEGDLNHQLAATEDRAEGLQAFFDKRPPDFSGR
ncbi:MAG: 2-oxoglutaroyl-CoA hydrolase [Acidimicrobiales bacterium]|jgi:2-oxoglutaroyl-CoA hydrolase